jgi:hypothetical protein
MRVILDENVDAVAALVNPKIIHYIMVNFQKAADLCVKQSILIFELITKVGKTDKLGKADKFPQNIIYLSLGFSVPI